MKHRTITVRRCGIGQCPYCLPHPFRQTINICKAQKGHRYGFADISARVKTFPKSCPLPEDDQ